MGKYDYEEYVQKYYCKDIENIENYEQAKTNNFKGWLCHHRLETHNSDGERRLVDISHKELKALDMYYNRPANELIFLKSKEHSQLHLKDKKGHQQTEETRKKLSESHKGKPSGREGKHHSDETKRKLSKAGKGKHWFNNGIINVTSFNCPDGFVPGRIKQRKFS